MTLDEWQQQIQDELTTLRQMMEELQERLKRLSMAYRQAWLMQVDAVERDQQLTPRTSELRKMAKAGERERQEEGG